MLIQIDTREKARAIKNIVSYFDRHDIKHISSKLYCGDYCDMDNPKIIVDRKQNIGEIAQNATSGHDRFKRELQRVDDIGAFMYVLIEQNKIDGKPIESIEDVMLWRNKYGQVDGMRIYRILHAWEHKHNVKFVFCDKRSTGRRIIELLGEKNE